MIVALVGIITSITYRVYIHYLRQAAIINFFVWDLKSCTSGDFTVSVELPKELWQQWKQIQFLNPHM